MIDLPTPELSEEWAQLDPRVRLVVGAVEEIAAGYGLPPVVVVTSLLRAGNPGSPHAHARAADLSVKNFPEALVRAILALRHRFPYGAEGFSSVILESPKYQDLVPYGWSEIGSQPWMQLNTRATGPHLHIQVPEGPTPGWEIASDEVYAYEREDIGRLPPDAARILYDNLDELYIDGTPAAPAGRTDMQSRKPSWAELEALVASGQARREDVVIPAVVVNGNKLYRMDDGSVMDRFAKARDYEGPDGQPVTVVLEDKQPAERFLKKLQKGLLGLLAILGSPMARTIGAIVGVDVQGLEERGVEFYGMTDIQRAAKILREVTPGKAHALVEELEKALADGRLDEEEAARVRAAIGEVLR